MRTREPHDKTHGSIFIVVINPGLLLHLNCQQRIFISLVNIFVIKVTLKILLLTTIDTVLK
jgi:hypothetical protein